MKKQEFNHQPSSSRVNLLTSAGIASVFMGLAGICFLLLFSTSALGQDIQELNHKLAIMKSSPNPKIRIEGLHLESLVYDIQPTLYYENGQMIKKSGEPQVKVNTDVVSMAQVAGGHSSNIEIICIRVQNPQELQMQLNLLTLNGYSTLKYVYFLCSFDLCPGGVAGSSCEIEKISRMVVPVENSGIQIVYQVSIPS